MGHRSASRVPRNVRWLVRVAPLWVFVLLAGACDEGAPTETFELSGVVSVLLESGETGGPIGGARVRFVSDTLIVSETETDDDGRYRMRVLTDFPFGQVIATADGFREEEATVFFDTPQRRVDLQLRRVPGEGD
ncbi:MAG TPA: carboxypeptidase-like regulatory domain-containing protein [Sandaracinaceae bacterium LLY-WYZ-13_1]|nr:carboxypeptidase-like regulatory domain-containing protein [Sandaracinaceae bacterium LLY-WYZ-13_1]